MNGAGMSLANLGSPTGENKSASCGEHLLRKNWPSLVDSVEGSDSEEDEVDPQDDAADGGGYRTQEDVPQIGLANFGGRETLVSESENCVTNHGKMIFTIQSMDTIV